MFANENSCRLFAPQLVANAILFVCVNCIGVFHLWTTEHDLRKSKQKREEFSAIRSRKEIRKYQQVNTLTPSPPIYFGISVQIR